MSLPWPRKMGSYNSKATLKKNARPPYYNGFSHVMDFKGAVQDPGRTDLTKKRRDTKYYVHIIVLIAKYGMTQSKNTNPKLFKSGLYTF